MAFSYSLRGTNVKSLTLSENINEKKSESKKNFTQDNLKVSPPMVELYLIYVRPNISHKN